MAKQTQTKSPKPKKLSRLTKPANMGLEDWQRELRRQFGREQDYELTNLGEDRFYSEFEVVNPSKRSSYRVRIRGTDIGDNHCTCPDFTTNSLGTCKHIEFTLAKLENKRGAKKAFKEDFQPPWSEIYLQYGSQREVRFRPGTECPVELARLASQYFDDEGILQAESYSKFDTFLNQAREHEEDLRCYEDVFTFVAEVRDNERRQQKVSKKFAAGTRSVVFKKLLKVPLYDYQKEGALFAVKAGRCLIGDEMGLGKTIQALAASEIMAKLFSVQRVLIVCPTSLKHQWEREIKRFTDRSVEVINGDPARRIKLYESESFYKITNYDTVYRDLKHINHWEPDLVILDEAQRIKNWETRTAHNVKQIQSPFAIVLTGTPLENRLEELISIVQFVDQYRLGPTFKLLHNHQQRNEVGRVVGYQNLHEIGKTLEPILIRRNKSEVLEQLPKRLDSNIFVPMTEAQRLIHEENMEIVARVVQKWREHGFLSEKDQTRLMIALQRMRMCCDNSYLVDHATDHGHKAEEAITILDEDFETPGNKAVVFSQWKKMHELLERRLANKDWKYVYFHGGLSSNKRRKLIDEFREDPECRLFLATDSGGTGLNLQNANMVMNMDLPWNPAVLEQRIGRVHRLGQTNPVRVINFVAQGTIEEGMLEVLRFKKSLFSGVLDGGESNVFLGGTRLNRFMKTVEKVTNTIPQAQPEEPETEPKEVQEQESTETTENPWTGLLQAGMAFLQQMTEASKGGSSTQSGKQKTSIIQRDENTGESYLKLPVPPPEVLNQVLDVVNSLLGKKR